MSENPVITAVTDIPASPDRVWRELTDFAGYASWHPALRFVDVPESVATGTRLRAEVRTGNGNDGEYEFTVLHFEESRLLVWEAGIPGVLVGRHSFAVEPHDGGTRFTDSEEFSGSAAVNAVEPGRARLEKDYAGYGEALKARVGSG
ncbi:SRPBCC domain-containing protein [Lentzea sp. NPDC058450]|uniref:SRPBCC domain-containing protein n=1 Tax=Lentzea sp. NPDC058450 TaxID=3346505 RepID=UPI00364B0320